MSHAASIPVSIHSASTREHMRPWHGEQSAASFSASHSARIINSDDPERAPMPSQKLRSEGGQPSGVRRTKSRTRLLTVIRADLPREARGAASETPRTASRNELSPTAPR